MPAARVETNTLRIIAQDPSVIVGGEPLFAMVSVPAEPLDSGPWGHRVQVIDYDASGQSMYAPLVYKTGGDGRLVDPFATAKPGKLIGNPQFHQQNVYAIVMRTLAHFERVLGRRLGWSFRAHQIKVVPHAFEDANAFYSESDQGLFFGYFHGPKGLVYTCLSHDVVAHETAHALLDGLRDKFTDPSSEDQAGFHEGFADVVALLSVFQLPETIDRLLSLAPGSSAKTPDRVPRTFLTREAFVAEVLLGLGEELGSAIHRPGRALRASLAERPNPGAYAAPEWQPPHRRGEILVAAMLRAFVRVWQARLKPLGIGGSGPIDRERVVEEGAAAAEHLLNIAIRGVDYTPPVHLTFMDYLSAILTADYEVQPNDEKYQYRRLLRECFAAWGIRPAQSARQPGERDAPEPGLWRRFDAGGLSYDGVHHEAMRRDPDEVFKFMWQNRKALRLQEEAYTDVLSVRPCYRVAPDGTPVRETVVELRQIWELTNAKRRRFSLPVSESDQGDKKPVVLTGGGTFIFDDFGILKYYIHNSVGNLKMQAERTRHILASPLAKIAAGRRIAELHRLRASEGADLTSMEQW